MTTITGMPAGDMRSIRANVTFDNVSTLIVMTFRQKDKDSSREFSFQADPVEFGASMTLALSGRSEATFTWMGMEQGEGRPWAMRTYWLGSDGASEAIEFLRSLKTNPEVDSSRLDRLVSRLGRQRRFVVQLESLEEKGERIMFPLSNLKMARFVSDVSGSGFSAVRLIGGLKVAVRDGSVFMAAGNSGFHELTEEQRQALRLGIEQTMEAERPYAFRIGQVAFFVPRGEGSIWDRGVRIQLLGRTVPFNDVRDVAKLAVLL